MIDTIRETTKERLALDALDYEVPKATDRLRYMLGGLTAFLIGVLIVTGLYLAQYYDPTPRGAHDSVLYLISRAPLGDWIRSVHYLSAGGVAVTVAAHLVYVFWRRSYKKPREVTWWAGVAMAGIIFLLIVTGAALRWDQEGFEALEHFVAGGRMTGALGAFFTEGFTLSTTLLSRIFSLHTSLLPLLLGSLLVLHFWLIRQLGINADYSETGIFRKHATRLAGYGLLLFAGLGLLAVIAPAGLGHRAVAGVEVTKPFWPVLWVYGLENVLGSWGLVLGPSIVLLFLGLVPLLDRGEDDTPGRHGWVGWFGLALGLAILGFGLYGAFGATQQHIGM
jgi:quinol-cytochrome oxidoreductase complex cytochrome b subunit